MREEGRLTVSLFHDIQRGMMMAVRVRPNAGNSGRSVRGKSFEQRCDSYEYRGRRLTDCKGQEAAAVDEAPGHTDSKVVEG